MKNQENEMYLAEIYDHVMAIQKLTIEYGYKYMNLRVTDEAVSVFGKGLDYYERNGKNVTNGEVA